MTEEEVMALDRIQDSHIWSYGGRTHTDIAVELPTRREVRDAIRVDIDACLQVVADAPAQFMTQKARGRRWWMKGYASDMMTRKLQLFALQRHAALIGVDISDYSLEELLVGMEARAMREMKERRGVEFG